MKKIILSFVFGILTFFIFIPNSASAQQGCCSYHGGISYCDTSTGRYVCNDNTYSPTCRCAYKPPVIYQPPAPKAPDISASFTFTPNSNGTFEVSMDWPDVTNTGYSIALQRYAGADPGPLTDTYNSDWVFHNTYPGTYYANMKVGINKVWSTIIYWKVNVPSWYPPPTPIAAPIATPLTNTHQTVSFVDSLAVFIHNLFTNKSNKSVTTTPKATGYICNCSKTCPNMTCAEAYYQLNECGCSARDGDGDGVPCEAQCK